MLPIQFSTKVCTLRSRYFKNGTFPTQENIKGLLWFKSVKTSQTFFNLLVAWEFIVLSRNWRIPTEKMTWIPFMTDQSVSEGFAASGGDNDHYVSFDLNKQLIKDINTTTLLKVSWESMIVTGMFRKFS